MTLQCQFEEDLLDALAANRWPERSEPALRQHVSACAICTDVAEIASAFFEDRDVARTEAPVPSASGVWWRAQIRAREESARMAARPIAVVQAAATVCAAAVSIAAAPAASTWIRDAIAAFGATGWWSVPRDVTLAWILSTAAYTTLPLLAVGVWVVLAPVVVYLALDE
ncbi:MAG: hypothetical protein ACRD15_09195 [Vicinamibacterales bacterium]